MIVIAISGLSLAGKTTLSQSIIHIYNKNGVRCIYRPRAHLTDNILANSYLRTMYDLINTWDFSDYSVINKYIELGFKSLLLDYQAFIASIEQYKNTDIIVLDRHFADHYVLSEYFGFNFEYLPIHISNYYEFYIECNYLEAIQRSKARRDNHGKLTDYILSNESIYNKFCELYRYYFSQKYYSSNHILDNNHFNAINKLQDIIDSLLKR